MRRLLFFCLSYSFVAVGAEIPEQQKSAFEKFSVIAARHKEENQREGMAYVIGGSVGFVSALSLSLTSRETMPKVGYALLQTLSIASVAHGAGLYRGDSLTIESERLMTLKAQLDKNFKISEEEKRTILDGMTLEIIRKEKDRVRATRRVRGYLQLASATAAGATIVLSKSTSTASNISLGFLCLFSLVGGISDTFLAREPKSLQELYTLEPILYSRGAGAMFSLRW
jgi:hypothetical protein